MRQAGRCPASRPPLRARVWPARTAGDRSWGSLGGSSPAGTANRLGGPRRRQTAQDRPASSKTSARRSRAACLARSVWTPAPCRATWLSAANMRSRVLRSHCAGSSASTRAGRRPCARAGSLPMQRTRAPDGRCSIAGVVGAVLQPPGPGCQLAVTRPQEREHVFEDDPAPVGTLEATAMTSRRAPCSGPPGSTTAVAIPGHERALAVAARHRHRAVAGLRRMRSEAAAFATAAPRTARRRNRRPSASDRPGNGPQRR